MNAMDDVRREEERCRHMPTSALVNRLARASGEDWVWGGAPSAPLHLADQELFVLIRWYCIKMTSKPSGCIVYIMDEYMDRS